SPQPALVHPGGGQGRRRQDPRPLLPLGAQRGLLRGGHGAVDGLPAGPADALPLGRRGGRLADVPRPPLPLRRHCRQLDRDRDRLSQRAGNRRAIATRSATKELIAECLDTSSGARRIEEGWTVAVNGGRPWRSKIRPRSRVTLRSGPSSAWAAVAPRQTIACGRTISISLSSHGRQAATSPLPGFSWRRRFPFWRHLKCLTVFVR